jgi:hypothetical protein
MMKEVQAMRSPETKRMGRRPKCSTRYWDIQIPGRQTRQTPRFVRKGSVTPTLAKKRTP